MTNSDRVHGDQVQGQLGFKLTDWLCAEQVRAYKPAPRFWQAVRELRRREFGPDWWHVSAYGDFDLEVAWALGLTCIFVDRPHQRPGRHHHWVADFRQLAEQIRGGSLEYLNVA
jgi:FMN phosphatase YigB (HAD superfamily)